MKTGKEDKKKTGFLYAMLAAALAVVLFLPPCSEPAKAEEGGGAYSLTVYLANEKLMKEDPDLADVTLNIYKVAGPEKEMDDREDTAWFTEPDAYRAYADRMLAEIVANQTDEIGHAAFGTAEKVDSPGYYMLVPVRGDSIERDDAGNVTVTTDDWIYTFNPMLLLVPANDPERVQDHAFAEIKKLQTDMLYEKAERHSKDKITQIHIGPPKDQKKYSLENLCRLNNVVTGDDLNMLLFYFGTLLAAVGILGIIHHRTFIR